MTFTNCFLYIYYIYLEDVPVSVSPAPASSPATGRERGSSAPAQPCSGRNFPTLVELCQPERLVGLTGWLTSWALQTSQQRQIVRLGRMYVCQFGKFEIDKYQNKVQIN